MTRATLGLRAHSGWAALVAIAGTPRMPVVIDRRRVELADAGISESKQPYHAAEGRQLKKAEDIVNRCTATTRRLATEAFRAAIADLRQKGHDVFACGLLLASGRPLPALEAILASHALIHTADGELFRDALIHAAGRLHLPVIRVREKELFDVAGDHLKIPSGQLKGRVAELGRGIGPPWTQDQKLAALIAWLTLVQT
jgi:hypothetical protein